MATRHQVDGVRKRFRLVARAQQTLKATVFSGFRRTVYEEFWALDGHRLRGAGRGRPSALVGHNGSGKSTLLKCMARIYRPDAGQHHDRRAPVGAARARRRVPPRAVGPGERLPERVDPRPVQARGRPRASTRSSAFSGLEQFIDTPGEELLVGHVRAARVRRRDQRRARGAARRRGARGGRRELPAAVPGEVRRPAQARAARIVVVSHGLDTVRNICDQAAWLDHGEPAQGGRRARGRDGVPRVRARRPRVPTSTRATYRPSRRSHRRAGKWRRSRSSTKPDELSIS